MKRIFLIIVIVFLTVSVYCSVNPYGTDSLKARDILIERGYKCDNSFSDYRKLCNIPHIFGTDGEKIAQYWYSTSNGDVNIFYQYAKMYILPKVE